MTRSSLRATAGGLVTSWLYEPGGRDPAARPQPGGGHRVGVDCRSGRDVKNGNVTITTVTDAPVTPIPGAPDCPNPQWTEDITDMAFTSATIRLFQDANANGVFDAGELVLTVNCTFSPPTSDGSVPRTGFTCVTARSPPCPNRLVPVLEERAGQARTIS